MDALSHALLGVAVAGLSGHPLSIHDPIYLASVIGAQAPDFDIIAILRGNFAFLRQHRAFSHSLPGIAIWSALITCGFFLVSQETVASEIFLWSFLGGLSHILLDFFNAHGAAVLWPLSRKRQSFSLLNVFDPLLLTAMVAVYCLQLSAYTTSLLFFLLIILYIAIRYLLKQQNILRLQQQFTNDTVERLLVMPSLKSIFRWDFVLETHDKYYVGQIGFFRQTLTIYTELSKQTASPATLAAHNTVIGKFFSTFTPFSYFTEYQDTEQNNKFVTIYDLRYFLNQDFLHSATIMFNANESPCDSYIKTSGRVIKVPC
ncbi:MAG: yfhP [Firmicutes bacterium]|nr:yfhP [Bacillota bacterium]